jgi:ribosomal protein L7Ae-like RNA K-turn-binding protein
MSNWLNLLGLALKSGNLITGESNIINKIRQGSVKLVIVALDASDNTKKLYHNKCNYYNIKCLELGTIDEISSAIGKKNRVAVGICDAGLSKGLLAKITK